MQSKPPVIDYPLPPKGRELPPDKLAQLRRVELIIIICLMSLPALILIGLGGLGLYVRFRGERDFGPTGEAAWWCLAIGSCFACVAIYAVIRLRRKVN